MRKALFISGVTVLGLIGAALTILVIASLEDPEEGTDTWSQARLGD